MSPPVYFVHLRRPSLAKKDRKTERRSDPFYEFCSFGCTTCHYRNLMHPERSGRLIGARLAFVQGGKLGSRLVFLTPPIVAVRRWSKKDRDGKLIRFSEVRWTATGAAKMPFKYTEAPVLAWNDHPAESALAALVEQFAMRADGRKIEGRLCSKIRSRAEPLGLDPPDPLELELARQVVKVYDRRRAKAAKTSPSPIASTYVESLPWPPPKPDCGCKARKARYDSIHENLHDETGLAEGALRADEGAPGSRTQSRCGVSRRRKSCCGASR